MSWYVRGRVAKLARPWWNLTKTVVQLALFWGFFLWLVPEVIHLYEVGYGFGAFVPGSALKVTAFIAVFLGCWLGLSCAVLIALEGGGTPMPTDSTRVLVVKGAYRHVRNPMVAAGSLQFGGVALWLGSSMTLVALALGILGWNFLIRRWEEWDMEERFGDDYLRYRAHVMCWRPRLKPYDHEAEDPTVSFPRTKARGDDVLLFDGHCVFCRRQAHRLKRWTGIIIVDFQVPFALDAFPGVTYEACMNRLHLVDGEGRVWAGVEAVVHTLARKPWGELAYVYYAPFVRLFCDFWYGWAGRHRYLLWGKTEFCDDACRLHTRRA